MAFQRPTLTDLVDRVQQDFVSRLGVSGATLRRSTVAVLARVVAGAAHMLHGHLDYLSRQLFPDTADDEFLLRHASIFGLAPKAAQFAEGTVAVPGTDGAAIPAESVLLRSDGATYRTTAEAVVSGGTATVPVVADQAGAAGTLDAGVELTFEAPIAGVNAIATVTAGTVDGSDMESTEQLRERLLDRLRMPPHGGAAADYVAWAREVPGVTRAWVYPRELGAGTVTVRFVRDDDASPIPDAAEVAAVQAHVDELRPVASAVSVIAPVAAPLNFEISVSPDTAEIRAAVEAELVDLLRRSAEPGSTVLVSQLRLAIGLAPGVDDFTLQAPAADVPHATGQLPTMGVVTWL